MQKIKQEKKVKKLVYYFYILSLNKGGEFNDES